MKNGIMKETINVLVIDDSEYYNNLLSNVIQQRVSSLLFKGKYQLVLRSVTDANDYVKKIEAGELDCKNTIVFVDYYLGNGINASHIISVLKEHECDPMVILISQSREVKNKRDEFDFDYFVEKDNLAPALCSLYLKQFIENRFSVTL
jgi:hypothetical protein